MPQKFPFYYDEEGDCVTLPYKWEICGHCRGEGKSSSYLGAFTWDDLREQGDEFIEDYFAGNYDRDCDCCDGTGKVPVADMDRMSEFQQKKWEEQIQAEIEYESERAAENRHMRRY